MEIYFQRNCVSCKKAELAFCFLIHVKLNSFTLLKITKPLSIQRYHFEVIISHAQKAKIASTKGNKAKQTMRTVKLPLRKKLLYGLKYKTSVKITCAHNKERSNTNNKITNETSCMGIDILGRQKIFHTLPRKE